MRKNEDKKNAGNKNAKSVLIGALVGFMMTVALFAIFAALITSGKISETLMPYLAVFSALIGAFIGSMTAVRRYKNKRMIVALEVGGVMFGVSLLTSVVAGGAAGAGSSLLVLAAVAAGSIAGGLLSLRKKTRRHA